MWEFPGGKQEPGETIESCIARELQEELGIEVTVGEELITVDHAYSHKAAVCGTSATGSPVIPNPWPASRCAGCGRVIWSSTPSLRRTPGSFKRCLAGWLALIKLKPAAMLPDAAVPCCGLPR